jgi:hypothetical protein
LRKKCRKLQDLEEKQEIPRNHNGVQQKNRTRMGAVFIIFAWFGEWCAPESAEGRK